MSKGRERIRDSALRYRQSLGQNFLYDDALLQELTAAAGVTKDEDVLEIGPGCGSLTKYLCDAAGQVVAGIPRGEEKPVSRAGRRDDP